MKNCIDCNKELSKKADYYGYLRCNSCAQKKRFELKPESNYFYKNGWTLKGKFCKECGVKISLEATKCKKCHYKNFSLTGKQNGSWKGGITPLHILIRTSDKYLQWRDEVFKRDNHTCNECDEKGCYLEAHHKKEFKQLLNEFLQTYDQFSPAEEKEILLRLALKHEPFWEISNGETLCKKCHKEKTWEHI